MKIAIDIGGTNTRIAQIIKENKEIRIIKETHTLTNNIITQQQLIKEIENFTEEKIDAIAIGAAGPIKNGNVTLTNFPLKLTKKEIENHFKCNIEIINDLEAIAYSLFTINKKKIQQIVGTPKGINLKENISILTPGTGLGEAYILKDQIFPSEGGHSYFSPTSQIEIDMIAYYLNKGKKPTFEYFLSGPGIINIYKYNTKYITQSCDVSDIENIINLVYDVKYINDDYVLIKDLKSNKSNTSK